MGWGWKKKKQWGSRYLHVSVNATQNGFTSWGWKVGPLSWNSRTRAHRIDGPGGTYYQGGKRSRGNRSQRRAGGDTPNRGRGKRKRRGALGAVTAWGVTWVARGARWSAVQTGQRTAGYAHAVTAPGRAALDQYRRHGGRPVVVDMTTGTEHRVSELPDPDYGDTAVNAAAERAWRTQHEQRAATLAELADRPLGWWDRLLLRLRGEDPDEWDETSRRIDELVAARRAQPEPEHTDEPGPTRPTFAAAGGTEEDDVSNPVRSMADLTDPAIDPDEYATELPEHIGDAARLVATIAEKHRNTADALRGEADALGSYAEYMETAEVDPTVLAPIRDAAEQLDQAAAGAAAVAEQWEAAADSLSGAGRAADAVYGEHRPPKFRKAG